MPEAAPGAERRALWADALRDLLAHGAEVQLLLGLSGLLLQCQEAPFLSPSEQREVTQRVFLAETGDRSLSTASCLDPDPVADGGHVLWLAAQSQAELADWVGAVQGAGCVPVHVAPFQRALLQGLGSLGDLPVDQVVLTVDMGRVGRLCIFHGRFLSLQRTFLLPEAGADAEELIFEEVSRLLQFFKQKNRGVGFRTLQILGLPELSQAFQRRLVGSLTLETAFPAPNLWPVLQEGLKRERARKDGLNLLPIELQEARQLKLFRNLVWGAFLGLGLLLVVASLVLFSQETLLAREVAQAERLLAEREIRTGEDGRIIQARMPLLRERLAERRQALAIARLGSLGLTVFTLPQGIQLEKVELLELPGDTVGHSFEITGLAFTERSFSVGPLAQYLLALGHHPGLTLQPVSEVSISDRVVEGREKKVEQMAITRFTLKGSVQ